MCQLLYVGQTEYLLKATHLIGLLYGELKLSETGKKRREEGRSEQLHYGVCSACRGAFIPFLVAGDPDLDTTAEAILELDRAGADIIELGVPYSVRFVRLGEDVARCNALHSEIAHHGLRATELGTPDLGDLQVFGQAQAPCATNSHIPPARVS